MTFIHLNEGETPYRIISHGELCRLLDNSDLLEQIVNEASDFADNEIIYIINSTCIFDDETDRRKFINTILRGVHDNHGFVTVKLSQSDVDNYAYMCIINDWITDEDIESNVIIELERRVDYLEPGEFQTVGNFIEAVKNAVKTKNSCN